MLARFFEKYPPRISPAIVLDLLRRLNGKIRAEKSLGKGFEIGHALFMEEDLDEEKLEMIWRYRILPLLEEYFFDAPERLGGFGLEEMITAG